MEDVRCRVDHGLRKLEVEIGLDAGVARVVSAAVDLLDSKGRVYPIVAEFRHESLQVLRVRVLHLVTRNPDRIPVHCSWHVVYRFVQPAQVQ